MNNYVLIKLENQLEDEAAVLDGETMNVGELVQYLKDNFEPTDPIVVRDTSGYYSGVTEDNLIPSENLNDNGWFEYIVYKISTMVSPEVASRSIKEIAEEIYDESVALGESVTDVIDSWLEQTRRYNPKILNKKYVR